MRILLIGKTGQVGQELFNRLQASGHDVIAPASSELDLADMMSVEQGVRNADAQLVINAAAYTAVDRAQDEISTAININGIAPGVIGATARDKGIAVIHYSTDYVYDGSRTEPYEEIDQPNPINMYGQSKLLGDRNLQDSEAPCLIFRTGWVYGTRGRNFLLTMRRLLQERDELSVVDDQIGTPTWSREIARATVAIIDSLQDNLVEHCRECRGVYNMSSLGQTTWYHFAEAIADYLQEQGRSVAELKAISTTEYPTPAMRPAYSVLDNTKLKNIFGVELPHWREAALKCLEEIEI